MEGDTFMKKLISIVLIVAMALCMFAVSAFAADATFTVTVSDGELTAGEEFAVTVSLGAELSGVLAMDFQMTQTADITYVSHTLGATGEVMDEVVNPTDAAGFLYTASSVDFDNGDTLPAGEIVTVYGEGAGNVSFYGMDGTPYSAPCLNVAFLTQKGTAV